MKRTTKSLLAKATACAFACGVTGSATQVMASARDADGARVQARSIALGSSQSDTLMPPRDRVDWRSFKVERGGGVTVAITHPNGVSVSVALSNSRGETLATATSSKGRASLSRTLEPGIYFVSVSSTQKARYEIAVR